MTLRVLVVDDSLTVRQRLCEILRSDPEIEVVGEASNGREAISLCLSRRPDVVTMDIALPVMSGLAATEYIMAHCPTPILVVSASFNRGETFKSYEALAAGAVDLIEKPTGSEPEGQWERSFLEHLKLVARVRVITHVRAKLQPPRRPREARLDRSVSVLAIGASTGGPGAVGTILSGLPKGFDIPILLIVHISSAFSKGLVDWLDAQSPRPVAFAKDGEALAQLRGSVRVAPPDVHLTVVDGRLQTQAGPERHSCRPSIDVLFESLARDSRAHPVGVLLTGMGKDGAQGLLELRRRGALTIAQDEASSVVYGMPREAALLDAAQLVLPLSEIPARLGRLEHGHLAEEG